MANVHWIFDVNGDFDTAGDWGGGSIPGPDDAAILDAKGAAFTVTATTSDTVGSLQLAANASLDVIGGTFTAGAGTGLGVNAGTISIGAGATFAVAGTVTNTGSIALQGTSRAHAAFLEIDGAGVTLVGGGLVTLTEGVPGGVQIDGAASATLTNVDNTVSGAGIISVGASLINEARGVIDANRAGYALIVNGAAVTNAGVLEATGSGDLVLYGSFDDPGTIDNRGGVIEATSHAFTHVYYEDVIGGSLIASGLGSIELSHVVLDGNASPVAVSGRLNIGSVTLRGAIDNSGVMYSSGGVYIDMSTTLSGGGTFDGFVGTHAIGVALVNVDNTIAGGLIGQMDATNEAQGVIDGIRDGVGIDLQGQTLTNAGLVEATGVGRYAGMLIEQTTIDNGASGIMLAAPGASLLLRTVDIMGGTLETSDRAIVFSRYANVLDGVAHAVTIEGAVAINNGASLTVQGAIVDRGSITLRASYLATDLFVGAPGVTLSGGGTLTLTDNGLNSIQGATPGAMLSNANDTISGAGLLGDGQMKLVNRVGGLIEATGSSTLTIDTGINPISNAGTIKAIGGGGLTIESRLTNNGLLSVTNGTLLDNGVVTGNGSAAIGGGRLYFARIFNQAVAFTGAQGVLTLARSQLYGGSVSGFSKTGGTSLDLRDIAFVSSGEATFSGTATSGVLTVSDGTHTAHIKLTGDYRTSTFVCASDGDGGVIIHDPAAPSSASPPTASPSSHAFVEAMARLGSGSPALASPAAHPWRDAALTLSAPRIQMA